MTDIYGELREAERKRAAAEEAVRIARQRTARAETAFREALPVSDHSPCSVGVLPSGRVVVHVWVHSSSDPNQIHIVRPGYIDEDGRPRKKFPNEQLGAGDSTE